MSLGVCPGPSPKFWRLVGCIKFWSLVQILGLKTPISVDRNFGANSSLWFCPCPCPVICPLFLPCNFCPVNFALCFALLVFVLLFLPLPLGWYFHFHCGCCVGGHFLITMIFIFQMLDLLSKTDGGWGGGWHSHDCYEDRVDVDSEGFELSFHNKKIAFDSDTKSIGIGCFHLRTGVGKRGSQI